MVYFDAKTNSELEKFKGKLSGKIVLSGAMRELKSPFDPMASRLGETNLLRLANAGPPRQISSDASTRPRRSALTETNVPAGSNALASAAEPRRFPPRRSSGRFLSFLQSEGAALIVNQSSTGDAGTFFVAAASVPTPEPQGTNAAPTNAIRVWSTNVTAIPPQIANDHRRIITAWLVLIQKGEHPKMAVDLQVAFHDEDLLAYNTIAELPGSDLKDEIVMVGAHLDSWHSGTGATDNGAGVAATMEAVRILSALNLQPRRTIRIGLWSGEEQGLMGSKAYVTKHFGYYTNLTQPITYRSPKQEIIRTSTRPSPPAAWHQQRRRTSQTHPRTGIRKTLRLFQPGQRRRENSRYLPSGKRSGSPALS